MSDLGAPLLEVDGLEIQIGDAPEPIVDKVSFTLNAGETLCIVGESGCGKSLTALALMGLLATPPLRRSGGKALFQGEDLFSMPRDRLRQIRGGRMAMIFQEPMSSLNPALRIGEQIAEAVREHQGVSAEVARARAVEMLERVRIPAAEKRLNEYPHQLSGGMRQRVMIAMALANNPSLLIADEPTTALDVTIQAQILELMRTLSKQSGAALIMITHDLGVVAEMADKVAVMYAGRIVEAGQCRANLRRPAASVHAGPDEFDASTRRRKGSSGDHSGQRSQPDGYAIGLPICRPMPLRCAGLHHCPRLVGERTRTYRVVLASTLGGCASRRRGAHRMNSPPILEAHDLKKQFIAKKPLFGARTVVRAVDGVDLAVSHGETFAIVGESGCGKSTLARLLVRLIEPSDGRVTYKGEDIGNLSDAAMRALRAEMQFIFQDPFSSLNPRMTVGALIEEPLRTHGIGTKEERRAAVARILGRVGLRSEHADRYPHEFSGGQRQRIGIARALVTGPKVLIGDEPVSALDVSIQAQVINILEDLKDEFGLTLIVIAHDLAVIRHMSDRVAVMYLGKIVEVGPVDALFETPAHPYTEALLAAIPIPTVGAPKAQVTVEGDPPNPIAPPSGCRFHTRCPHAKVRCETEEPALTDIGNGRVAACHFTSDLTLQGILPDAGHRSPAAARRFEIYGAARAANEPTAEKIPPN